MVRAELGFKLKMKLSGFVVCWLAAFLIQGASFAQDVPKPVQPENTKPGELQVNDSKPIEASQATPVNTQQLKIRVLEKGTGVVIKRAEVKVGDERVFTGIDGSILISIPQSLVCLH